MPKETIIAACGQFRPEFGETEKNINRMIGYVENDNANLFVLPELITSGYEIKDRKEALELGISVNNALFGRIKKLAGDTNTHIVFGFPELVSYRVFNSAALVEPSGRVTVYRKIHLFDREKNLFDKGDHPPQVISTEIGKIGMMICFDWIFPETTRLLALGGAQIIVHPSNLVLPYCQRAMYARSVENRVFTMTCNRIGAETRTDRTLTFTGGSQILSNKGEPLAQAGVDTEEVISAEITPSQADNKMITELNHIFEDRRKEFYGGLVK